MYISIYLKKSTSYLKIKQFILKAFVQTLSMFISKTARRKYARISMFLLLFLISETSLYQNMQFKAKDVFLLYIFYLTVINMDNCSKKLLKRKLPYLNDFQR